jgi:hypothetical protein
MFFKLTTLLQRIKSSLFLIMLNSKEDKSTVIETQFFILTPEQYEEHLQDANELGISIDYYLSEFCEVQGPKVTAN